MNQSGLAGEIRERILRQKKTRRSGEDGWSRLRDEAMLDDDGFKQQQRRVIVGGSPSGSTPVHTAKDRMGGSPSGVSDWERLKSFAMVDDVGKKGGLGGKVRDGDVQKQQVKGSSTQLQGLGREGKTLSSKLMGLTKERATRLTVVAEGRGGGLEVQLCALASQLGVRLGRDASTDIIKAVESRGKRGGGTLSIHDVVSGLRG
jgi:hypothetical protein